MTAPIDDSATPARNPRTGGPRARANQDAARRNTVRHGLRSRVAFPEDLAETIADRAPKLSAELNPRTPADEFLVAQIALAWARFDRCTKLESDHLRALAERARLYWDDDRRAEAEAQGAKLARDPSRTVASLRCSKHGTDWLIARWESLRDALHRSGGWDDDQRGLALDLLGTPTIFRPHNHLLPEGADLAKLSALVEYQLDELRTNRDGGLSVLDDKDRQRAAAGLLISHDPALDRLQRCWFAAQRDLSRSMIAWEHRRRAAIHVPAPAPRPTAAPAPTASPSRAAGPAPTRPGRPIPRRLP